MMEINGLGNLWDEKTGLFKSGPQYDPIFEKSFKLNRKSWDTLSDSNKLGVMDSAKNLGYQPPTGLLGGIGGQDMVKYGLVGANMLMDKLDYGLEKDKTGAYLQSLAEQTAYNKRMEANKKNIEGDFKNIDWS